VPILADVGGGGGGGGKQNRPCVLGNLIYEGFKIERG
jgi:hypothetical protein